MYSSYFQPDSSIYEPCCCKMPRMIALFSVCVSQDQLSFVAAMTSTQTSRSRRRASVVSSSPEKGLANQLSVVAGANMTPELQCMKPLLRFLQLLCENHHREMQVSIYQTYLRYRRVSITRKGSTHATFIYCFPPSPPTDNFILMPPSPS